MEFQLDDIEDMTKDVPMSSLYFEVFRRPVNDVATVFVQPPQGSTVSSSLIHPGDDPPRRAVKKWVMDEKRPTVILRATRDIEASRGSSS